ncbi:hypothetical protein [Ramlibacter sp. AN1133]|uniref:hypothetical protein n=1 Tax=Ramlibacter sp. AN1133 TaxID=3133429 RepID=UPI0030C3E5F4
MSPLYTVYTHALLGHWGFAALVPDGQVRTAAIDPAGRASLGTIEPMKLAPLLQGQLRAGYRKGAPRYLQLSGSEPDLKGAFVSQHPELDAGAHGELLFFVAVPQGMDMIRLAEGWRERLQGMPGGGRGRDEWLRHCGQSAHYLALKGGDVRAALLVAEWARNNQLVLVSSAGELPVGPPDAQRHDWRNALAQWFQGREIEQALADFGWLPDPTLAPIDPAPAATAPSDAGEWLALARQASF